MSKIKILNAMISKCIAGFIVISTKAKSKKNKYKNSS